MNICPCCGFASGKKKEEGCAACGAVRVGPPLATSFRALPAYGASLVAGLAGPALLLLFGAGIIAALFERQRSLFDISWSDLMAAAESSAWRLKYLLPALALAACWAGVRAFRRSRREPERYTGKRLALAGTLASLSAFVLVTSLIGVTLPARLEQRALAARARNDALLYSYHRILNEYRIRYKTYPADRKDLLKLPDADGSVAALLAQFPAEGYSVSAEQASLPASRTRKLRGVRLQPVALRAGINDLPDAERISFTNYVLRLPGADGLPNTEDDLVIRDGMIVDETADPAAPAAPSAPVAGRTRGVRPR